MERSKIDLLPWGPKERFGLVRKGENTIFYGSDDEEHLKDVLAEMQRNNHPEKDSFELIARYKEVGN